MVRVQARVRVRVRVSVLERLVDDGEDESRRLLHGRPVGVGVGVGVG